MRIITSASILFLFCFTKISAQALYAPNQITLVEISFQESDWDQILKDFYEDGAGERLLASVEINGVHYDSVGIRYRGGNTYDPSNAKNPMSIKLDYIKAQDYKDFGVLKLDNGAKDPSWLRQVLSYDIARQYMEAPQANYASVYINGNFHGLYNNVESINSNFTESRFGIKSKNPRFECSPSYSYKDPPQTAPFGCTVGHGSSLEYLGNGIACYLEHYAIQSNTGWEELRDMTFELKNNPGNARDVLDLDRFIWMSALNSLLANLDSYLGAGTRNYYIAKSNTGRFVPIPDDMDQSFGRFPWATVDQTDNPQPPLSYYTTFDPFFGAGNDAKPILKTIFDNPTWKRMYTAHLRTMIEEIFAGDWFEQRVEALQNLISGEVLSDASHFYTYNQFLQNLNATVVDSYDGEDAYGLIPLMNGRVAYLLDLPEFQATPPAISEINIQPENPQPGATATISVSVNNATTVMMGFRSDTRDMFELLPMFDDGNHGDGAASDGVYGVQLAIPLGGIQYYIYAENDQAGAFLPKRAEFKYFHLNTFSDVVINEFMASNQTTVTDQNGQYEDWAEFYNNSGSTVDLSGWHLSDNPSKPDKWKFPNGVFLNAGAYLIVWLDDDTNQDGLHASFKLSAAGEVLLLSKPDLTLVDKITFGAQTPDISFSRCPNGTGSFIPTPSSFAADNTQACLTDTNEPSVEFEIKIFPNPAGSMVRIQTETPGILDFNIRSSIGQIVRSGKFRFETKVEVGDLPPGLYIVEIAGRLRHKLLVIR